MVQYNTIMHTSLQCLRYYINQGLHSQKTPHTSPSQMSYGMYVVRVLQKTDNIITTLYLTHWGRVTHKCVSKLIIIRSDNGLSPERRQAIIWTIVGILLIGTLGTNFSHILSQIHTFSFKKMHLKMSSAKCWPSCLGLNVLMPSAHT